MTKKEEAQLKRLEKLQLEQERTRQMKVLEMEVREEFYAGNPKTDMLPCLICGVDEAGRGPFAGPVVAGAVILDLDSTENEILYLNDSKKLSEKKREVLYREILQKAVAVGVGYAGPKTIDSINILQATYKAMRQAIASLTPVSAICGRDEDVHEIVKKLVKYEKTVTNPVIPDYILADAVTIPEIGYPQKGIIKGDARSISIAAGSIIAKVTRDHIMYEYDTMYPEYGFASHKGYGTRAHIQAIRTYGMTPIHRRSFIHL